MATNGNNLEPEFDALLKAHVKQHTNVAVCHQFDPDDATAYLERAMSKTALATFEEHLASCAVCRRHLIELSRLLPSQPIVVTPIGDRLTFKERLGEWFSGWGLGALAGLSAVAATVLVVAVVVNRSASDTAPSLVADNRNAEQVVPLPSPALPDISEEELKLKDRLMRATPGIRSVENQEVARVVPSAPSAATQEPQAVGVSGVAIAPPPPPTLAPSKAEAERKDSAPSQAATAGAVVVEGRVQNLRAQTPSGPEVNQLQVDRALERSKKSNEAAVQSADAVAREAAKPAPKLADKPKERIVEKMDEEADQKQMKARAAKQSPTSKIITRRVVSGKTFRQENGIWIDEAYDANKGLPVVRLTRDSDEYKQTLGNIPSLKPYFDLKPVLVVWQGKVYRVEK